MTPEQRKQVDACKRMIEAGATPADLRDMGFAEGAIQCALREVQAG